MELISYYHVKFQFNSFETDRAIPPFVLAYID